MITFLNLKSCNHARVNIYLFQTESLRKSRTDDKQLLLRDGLGISGGVLSLVL